MKILLCHNYYQQRGGEDQSFEDEAWLLEKHGHEVIRYTVHNDAIRTMSHWTVAGRTIWSGKSFKEVGALMRSQRPELIHCTNTFPLISPSIYYAARAERVPVVQSLRNYRLMCPNALFSRNGRVCEDCLGKMFAWPAVLHGCYRGSRAGSAVVAAMSTVHRALGTWAREVRLWITPSRFARQKYIEGGFPGDKIAVQPNFVRIDPGPGTGRGGYGVFVGRLSEEKGIDALLAAWPRLKRPLPLKIVGDGPMAARVRAAAEENPAIQWLGARPAEQVLSILGEAAFVVVPSVCYETFGRVVIEAFSKGTPAVVSRVGSLAELVEDGRAGMCFEAGNVADLTSTIDRLQSDDGALSAMRQAARREFLEKYTAESNYPQLMAQCRRALGEPEGTNGHAGCLDTTAKHSNGKTSVAGETCETSAAGGTR